MCDVIAAVATAPFKSAIAIVRLSGSGSHDIAARIFSPDKTLPFPQLPSHRFIRGKLHSLSGAVLDHCGILIARAPSSYTGEDTVEFHCHGSPALLNSLLNALFILGARQALPGEFTKRAFLNGKLDLIQAEAVADLTDAETEAAVLHAAAQLSGTVSRALREIYDAFLDILAHFHAILDYPDEELDPFDSQNLLAALNSAAQRFRALLSGFERGRIIKDGLICAIIGRPNAGKSSLLNALLGFDRAIVTPLPGTTRDTIEEKVLLGSVLLRLIDTAGVRETNDELEALGIQRSIDAVRRASLVLAVFDGSLPLSSEDFAVIDTAKTAAHSIALINKSELPQLIDADIIGSAFNLVCRVSALDRSGLDLLEAAVVKLFGGLTAGAGEILTNARQAAAVRQALSFVEAAMSALSAGTTPDAVLTDVEAAMSAIGEANGSLLREEITARIFERFCVGK